MVWPLYRTKIEGALLRKGAKQGGTAEVTAFRLWNCRGGGPFVFLPERMFQMKNVQKYARNYFAPPAQQYHWSQREYIAQAPRWCSVDLRDGNQALVEPMDLGKKRGFFQFLCRLGFREIEVGFPAASDTEYQFVRTLIEHNLIPDDVTIQVITPAREQIIRRTFEALAGCKKAIVHLYNPTSAAQREQVFHKSRGQIIDIALQGVRTIADCAGRMKGQIQLEYTPESFTGTEPDFALAICDAVVQEWKPTAELPVILNLASTMSLSLPHIYANQIEYMDTHLRDRDKVILSLHPHNDRGSAIAEADLFDYTIPPPRMEAELPEIFPAGKNFSPGLPLGPGLCYNGGKPEREEGTPWPRGTTAGIPRDAPPPRSRRGWAFCVRPWVSCCRNSRPRRPPKTCRTPSAAWPGCSAPPGGNWSGPPASTSRPPATWRSP